MITITKLTSEEGAEVYEIKRDGWYMSSFSSDEMQELKVRLNERADI